MRRKTKREWVILGIAGLMAISLTTCSKIPGDGSSGNRAGKNFYISAFAANYDPDTFDATDSTSLTGNTCPPTIYLAFSNAYLNTGGFWYDTIDDIIWVVVQNDSTAASPATEPENTVIILENVHVEYEVGGATVQIPAYNEFVVSAVGPAGGVSCYAFHVFPQQTRDFINQNRSAFPGNNEPENSFQLRARVQAQGYETNGGYRIETPVAYFTIHVYNRSGV